MRNIQGGFANNGYYYPVFPQQNQIQIAYVNGAAGAKSYALTPNQQIWLLDIDSRVLYYKEMDGAGKTTMQGYSLTEIETTQKEMEFATKSDLKQEIEGLRQEIMSLKATKPKTPILAVKSNSEEVQNA